jgi:hypothetical protein
LPLVFMVLFYGLFFGAGFMMAKNWFEYRRLCRRFGMPLQFTAAKNGNNYRFSVRFDHPWPADAAPSAALHHVVIGNKQHATPSKGDPEFPGIVSPLDQGSEWSATIPALMTADSGQLELWLRPDGRYKQGWRFAVEPALRDAMTPAADISPEQIKRLYTVTGRLLPVLLLASAGLLWTGVGHQPISLAPLLFGLLPLLGANALWRFRQRLGTAMNAGGPVTGDFFKKDGSIARDLQAQLKIVFALVFVTFVVKTFMPLNRWPDINAVLGGVTHLPAPSQTPNASQATTSPDNDKAGKAFAAVNAGDADTLRQQLDQGLNPDLVNPGNDSRGENLLMTAARTRQNSIAMIDALLSHGARLDAKDSYGKNATDWAEFFGNPDASDELCRHGLEPTALDTSSPNNEVHKRASCAVPSAVR